MDPFAERFANTRHGTAQDVAPYLALVHRFVTAEIDAQTYEVEFVDLWKQQRFFLPAGMDEVMERLFYANQDFVHHDHLRDPGDLDAEQFRARVAELEPELVARFEEARLREADDTSPADP